MQSRNKTDDNWQKLVEIPSYMKIASYGSNKYLLILSFLSPHHLIGIGLLAALFLSRSTIVILSIICVIYPLIKQILRYYNWLPTPHSSEIIRHPFTARCDGDFVVCLIGIRPNGANPFTKSFIEIGKVFRQMMSELESDRALGYMGGDIYIGANQRKSSTLCVQYWRDYESLEKWTHTKMGIHLRTIMNYKQNHQNSGEYGVWHETYKIKDGDYESIYVNMPPIGLALATEAVYEEKSMNAAHRLLRRKQ